MKLCPSRGVIQQSAALLEWCLQSYPATGSLELSSAILQIPHCVDQVEIDFLFAVVQAGHSPV